MCRNTCYLFTKVLFKEVQTFCGFFERIVID
nr:MAG TPA: hypothetical protein [Caudoviricetes sp.]